MRDASGEPDPGGPEDVPDEACEEADDGAAGREAAAAAPRAAASTVRRGVGLLGVLLDMALVPQSSTGYGWW
ncbi:hypothetical protein [Streptomyces telluris]|uniref:Uncharacterized protein n=1 Tax=Streptomyces telluris TaxID=2720021 RepID=A0A9X2LM01_9ACTN|nr:hypothetical protein [Streptomyces telluris]MCQ8773302.1 hypothetical protein [Streptomyces telluris]